MAKRAVPQLGMDISRHECAACQTIDRSDGIEDFIFGHVHPYRTRSESSVLAHIRRAEGHAADKITGFAGSMKFIYLHIGWFAVWILINVGLAGFGHPFDRFPFGLLTLVVSLEAIFLATFVMISQNRQAARSDIRAQLDFENNIRSEIWSVHIGHVLGIDSAHVEGVIANAIKQSHAQLSDE